VTVSPPNPSNAVRVRCASLNDLLPPRLGSLKPRVISPRTPLVHVWGDPPVLLACGVPAPAGYSPQSSETTNVDGVSWFQQPGSKDVVWTAVRGSAAAPVYVRLTVPTSYQGQGAFLVALAGSLKRALPDS
jgi:hypothetical protein